MHFAGQSTWHTGLDKRKYREHAVGAAIKSF
jgi:hypothetical protein